MKSKTLTITIIIATIIGLIAIVSILAIVITTTKDSEPRVINLNEETDIEEELNFIKDGENEVDEDDETEERDENENTENSDTEEEDITILTDNLENKEVESFNSRFTRYEGNEVSAEDVNSLLKEIRNNNDENERHQIRALASVENWDYDSNNAKENCYYKVECVKDDQTGYITSVQLTDAD